MSVQRATYLSNTRVAGVSGLVAIDVGVDGFLHVDPVVDGLTEGIAIGGSSYRMGKGEGDVPVWSSRVFLMPIFII